MEGRQIGNLRNASDRRPVSRQIGDSKAVSAAGSARNELLAAIAVRRSIADRGERLRAAIAQARENSLTAMGLVDEAEAALAKAQSSEQHRAVALALNEVAPPGPSVEQARAALAAAQHEHRLARDAIATLEGGIAAARLPVSTSEARVKAALVLESEGAVDGLLMAYDLARSRAAQIADVLLFLGPSLVGHPGWDHRDRPIPPFDGALVSAWRAVLRALEAGEDCPLPEIL
jgi:hypothetical protein